MNRQATLGTSGALDVPPNGSGNPVFHSLQEEIEALERSRMRQALLASGGNQQRAAELLQMPLRTFQRRVQAYGLAKLAPHCK
jgi:DNA-binding NtrC family response regulator